MPPKHRPARLLRALFALSLLGLAVAAAPAWALRIVDYNILNYPGDNNPDRDPSFRTIFATLNADCIVVDELESSAGLSQFLNNVLNFNEPGQWSSATFVNGNDTDCGFFYKPSKVQYIGQWAFYPDPVTMTRAVHVYRIRPVGYTGVIQDIRLYGLHLKSSTGFESQRLAECTGLRDTMNAMPAGTHGIALGDFNFYTQAAEPGYDKLIESQGNNIGRTYDPLSSGSNNWHTNASFAAIHTQSPCLSCANGGSGGGMDDRFDFFFPTLNLNDGTSIDIVPGSYVAVGNDAQHYNKAINASPTIPEGIAYANALALAADHLPIRLDLRLPCKITAPATLAMGSVITGGSVNLDVTNPAVAPAEVLSFTLTPPANFTAPIGTRTANAGAVAGPNPITPNPALGSYSGTLGISSNSLENPSLNVSLSATVIDHADGSLDSIADVHASQVDFDTTPEGFFQRVHLRVFNRNYTSQRARLLVSAANITGGNGRFSIVNGFTPSTIGATGKDYEIAFDNFGATHDSLYTATLTFTNSDESLPGAFAQPNLVVTLRAQATAAQADVPAGSVAARWYPPYPNPLVRGTTLAFDLARSGAVRLEIFDLHGRLVSSIANGEFQPGTYRYAWAGVNDAGVHVGPGVYFARFSGPGLPARSSRIALIR